MLGFSLINQPNLYGYERTVGRFRAEVIRAYVGDWFVAKFVDGKQIQDPSPNGQGLPFLTACAEARNWLASQKV